MKVRPARSIHPGDTIRIPGGADATVTALERHRQGIGIVTEDEEHNRTIVLHYANPDQPVQIIEPQITLSQAA